MNKIFHSSSESMKELQDKSVDLMVTSPPYNININYGNKSFKTSSAATFIIFALGSKFL